MNKKFFHFISMLFISVNIFSQTVCAASGSNFSVRTVIPENQVDKNETYYDLRLAPNEKQTIQLIIDNSEAVEIIASVALNAASTGRNGLIVYNQPDIKDESLSISITDIAKILNPEVTVPANGSAIVEVEIQMPEQSFDGVILGGLVTTARKTSENQSNQSTGTTLNNEYAYVTGLKITENDTEITPDFEYISVTPGLVNYYNSATIHLRNKMPLIVKGMEIDAKIYRDNSKDVFRQLNLSYAEMAPNSVGDFVVDWESAVIEPGTYQLNLTATYQDKEWVWNENFTISQPEANEANSNAVNLTSRPVWLYAVIIVLILIIFILVFVLVCRTSKKER